MIIYGNDVRTGKRSSAVQKPYVKQPSEPPKKITTRAYDAAIKRAQALAQELKNDPNHPAHGTPRTDRIRKADWCMCDKCEARREYRRRRYYPRKGQAQERGEQPNEDIRQ